LEGRSSVAGDRPETGELPGTKVAAREAKPEILASVFRGIGFCSRQMLSAIARTGGPHPPECSGLAAETSHDHAD
jgi:hypothetical protein